MDAAGKSQALEDWFREHGGYLNPSVNIAYSHEAGYRWKANAPLTPGSKITTVPHSLALSYLNALVDDDFPVFRDRRHDFKIEALGFFYLMAQYIHRERSFWRPYLDTLPSPDSDLTTPLWFDDAEDLGWLHGTDVLHTMLARREVYERYYKDGLCTLRSSGVDTTPYTWNLFRWSITMFTSRSFSSRAIAPQESKYWTTYKMNTQGWRQTVLLDMSHAPAEDLDFSVLFPLQDASNHSNDAHVDWSFDPGRFSISINDPVEAGGEVLNNYGWKGNDELLMGYGFCIPDNPYDTVMLTLKPPPEDLQKDLSRVHPGYFTAGEQWSSERATFRLRRLAPAGPEAERIFQNLPEPLLELLLYILRWERGLPFEFQELPLKYLTTRPTGRHYLPHVARMIVQSLMPRLQKLQDVASHADDPRNNKQRQAGIYRSGQIEIIQATIAGLRTFTRSLLKPPMVPGPRFVTLEGLLQLWSHRASAETAIPFIAGIEAVSGTADVDQLRQAGWEEDVMILLLCYIYLEATRPGHSQRSTVSEHGDVATVLGLSHENGSWAEEAVPEYVDLATPRTEKQDIGVLDHASGLMELVATVAGRPEAGASMWDDDRWCVLMIAELGGKMLRFDSLTMMVPGSNGVGEEARLVVYLHAYM
ncbi:hypothetical protein B0A54_07844 [Friedmanniomyces endolithicus]|uniref:SET domain-containing protein n=1 Tax=Friedmanniomyces endolithicus TaxID=329885 RepID=A0A4U0UYS9_9PEZI|nr:hypothetical protein LTS09_013988 [Friedmanniomyces endolithicus]TKA40932.1 hypothetical protein B0A54_07844 [Friedmanniomyces endolithicus]